MRILITIIFCLFISISNSQHVAVIGDFGANNSPELMVSTLVKAWNPDFIITTGDNNYPYGAASTIDENIGKYYHEYIYPYTGSYGLGDTVNRFFPTIGNHDAVTNNGQPYINYFALPGNERYYDFIKGDIHFFALNSDNTESDETTSTSVQGQWLKNKLATSTSLWKIVYFHHPPYSSDAVHGNRANMQWPFKEWGATAVLAGHAHTYERLFINDLVYFVNGLGGKSIYGFAGAKSGSQVRYNANYGAMQIKASKDSINFSFSDITGKVIDSYTILANAINISELKNSSKISFSPNPFDKEAKFRYKASANSKVKIVIYDVSGQKIAELSPENTSSDEIIWQRKDLHAGVYFYTLFIDDKKEASGEAVITN